MAIIKIKRSVDGIAAPSSLSLGELAITIQEGTTGDSSNLAGRLFVGNNSGTAVPIGGEYTYGLLDHTPGVLEDNSALIVGTGGTISGLNITGVATIAVLNAAISEFSSLAIGSSISVGVASDPDNSIVGLDDGSLRINSLTVTGVATDAEFFPIPYFDTSQVLQTTSRLSWRDQGNPPELYVDGNVAAASSVTGPIGIFTAVNVTELTVGGAFPYAFPTARGNNGQILRTNDGGDLIFATFDQQLNTIASSGSGSVGLSSQFLRVLGTDLNINTVAVGNTITISLADDILVGGGMTVTGDLTVNGNLTYLSSTVTQIQDKNIELAVPETGSPTDGAADGGGITVKGGSDYTLTWSQGRSEWVVNQGFGPSDNTLNLGSSSTRWNTLFATRADVVDLNVTGVSTFASFSVQGGSLDNVEVGIGTSQRALFTTIGFTTASGGDTTLKTLVVSGVSTVASLFLTDSLDTNGVAYAGTEGKVGFTSAPTAGISTSTYILTSLGGVPVYTDTIDCGNY